MNQPTPVIFRQFQDGTPICIFPVHQRGLPCMTFTEHGEFGEADYDSLMRRTRPVRGPSRLIGILRRQHGYRQLRIYKRMQGWMVELP